MSSPASATSMLDKLLARSAALQQKLDSMTTSKPGGARAGELREAVKTGGPSAMLDRCLTRTHALNSKVDKLSTDMVASKLITNSETSSARTKPDLQDAPKQQVHGCAEEGEIFATPPGCVNIVDPTVDKPASCDDFVADREVMANLYSVAFSLFDSQTV